MHPQIGELALNRSRSVAFARQAMRGGAQLVVLPEACTSGYVFSGREEAMAYAEKVPDGSTSQSWAALCAQFGSYLVGGVVERVQGKLYNSAVFFGPSGHIGTFRKVHLWKDERMIFEPGDLGFPVFETEIGRIGMHICYDGWFPESYRLCALQEADMICVPANWVPVPGQLKEYPALANLMVMTGAHSNLVYIAAASRVGIERGQEFIGRSIIVDYTGWPLAGPATESEEEVISADVDLLGSRECRRRNKFNHPLLDRRPDVYDQVSDRPAIL